MSEICWIPLESNPEILNTYIGYLGVESNWKFMDIWGFEEELLSFIPRTAVALILLFPVNEEEDLSNEAENQSIDESRYYFIKQTIRNACGTIAIIHSIANNMDKIDFKSESCLKEFIKKTEGLKSFEKAEMLEKWEDIGNCHQELAQEGQSSVPQAEQSVDHHFIALVNRDGTIYEFDGRKTGPIPHCSTNEYDFVVDAGRVCRKFMSKKPDSLRFTAVALVKSES